eukprot:488053-Pleurochrysis_carterae.AAC.1
MRVRGRVRACVCVLTTVSLKAWANARQTAANCFRQASAEVVCAASRDKVAITSSILTLVDHATPAQPSRPQLTRRSFTTGANHRPTARPMLRRTA